MALLPDIAKAVRAGGCRGTRHKISMTYAHVILPLIGQATSLCEHAGHSQWARGRGGAF